MTDFSQSLREWRTTRRFSQLDLALEAEVSSRHISFLETGRAQPSAEMVARLGEALRLPLEARNQLFQRAGFAARYPGRAWDAEEMQPVRQAVERMLSKSISSLPRVRSLTLKHTSGPSLTFWASKLRVS